MKYTVRKSIVDIVGRIWMPNVMCSQRKDLSSYDVGNIKDIAYSRADGPTPITREDVEQWLSMNAGDFSEIIDFRFSIEDGEQTVGDFEFATEDGEWAYNDTMATEED